MHICNKSAWILPNYLAQDIFRKLTKSGKHSDVGTHSYSSPFLYVELRGLFPLSLLNQFSKIAASGVIEWWPNFINRTDLSREDDKLPPTKPNMKGHTQVIFIILGSGLSFSLSSMFLELSGSIVKYLKFLCSFICILIQSCIYKFPNVLTKLFRNVV